MVGDSLAAMEAAAAEARKSHQEYEAELVLTELRITPEFREVELEMARDQAALFAMETSVAGARKTHLEREVELALAQLGIAPEPRKADFELARNKELVAMEAAVIEAREVHQRREKELALAQLRISPEFREVELAMAETQAALVAKIVEDAHAGVLRAEDELTATKKRLDATIGKVVLTGVTLERDVDLVRKAVAHGSLIAEGRKQRPVDQDYARWCLDVAIHRVKSEIKAAVPASDEKERLKISLESLGEQYEIVSGKTPVPKTDYLRVLTEILECPENLVDEEWLAAQREVLNAREPTKAKKRALQVDLTLTR